MGLYAGSLQHLEITLLVYFVMWRTGGWSLSQGNVGRADLWRWSTFTSQTVNRVLGQVAVLIILSWHKFTAFFFFPRYRALYAYRPQNEDELELREGDEVFVMEKCDDGWFVGTSAATGCFGTFPGNYVQKICKCSTDKLLRKICKCWTDCGVIWWCVWYGVGCCTVEPCLLTTLLSNHPDEQPSIFDQSRIAQTTAALTKLKPVWNDRSISLISKLQLMSPVVVSIFLYTCESWTSRQSCKEEYKPWKLDATARYFTSHTKTMLPARKSVPISSRQSDHTKTSWPS